MMNIRKNQKNRLKNIFSLILPLSRIFSSILLNLAFPKRSIGRFIAIFIGIMALQANAAVLYEDYRGTFRSPTTLGSVPAGYYVNGPEPAAPNQFVPIDALRTLSANPANAINGPNGTLDASGQINYAQASNVLCNADPGGNSTQSTCTVDHKMGRVIYARIRFSAAGTYRLYITHDDQVQLDLSTQYANTDFRNALYDIPATRVPSYTSDTTSGAVAETTGHVVGTYTATANSCALIRVYWNNTGGINHLRLWAGRTSAPVLATQLVSAADLFDPQVAQPGTSPCSGSIVAAAAPTITLTKNIASRAPGDQFTVQIASDAAGSAVLKQESTDGTGVGNQATAALVVTAGTTYYLRDVVSNNTSGVAAYTPTISCTGGNTPSATATAGVWSITPTGTNQLACTITNTAKTYTVQATSGAGGAASCTPSPVFHGATSQCTATPAAGYVFAGWTGACAGQGALCSLSDIQANQNSQASFATIASLSLAKVGPASMTAGQSYSYTLTVTNSGQTASASSVVVQDQLPAGMEATSASGASCTPLNSAGALLNCTIAASIAPNGGTASFTLTVKAPATGGSITNYASVNPAGAGSPPAPGVGCTGAHCANATSTVTPKADLSIAKTASPSGTYVPGQALNYQIVVSNAGPSAVNGATVNDSVPTSVAVTSWSCTPVANCGATSSGSSNSISLSGVNLASGQSISISISGTAQLSATGNIVNSATVTPPAGVSCSVLPCSKTSTTTNANSGAPQLSISKTATPAAFAVGQTGTYSILVGNGGTSSTAGAISVSDPMPAGVSITLPVTASGWDCSASSASQLACTTAVVLLPGANAPVINAQVSIANGAPALVTNTATVSGGGAGCTSDCQSTVSTNVNMPRLDVTKTLSSPFVVGVANQYVITATNNGQAATLAGTITDDIPAGLTVGTMPAGCSVSGQTVICSIAAGIATGGSVSFTIPVTPQASANGQSLVNTAIAQPNTGDPGCPAAAHCSGTTDNPVTAPQLSLTKQTSVGTFTVGVPAQYTLTLSNTGTAPTTGAVTVSDTVPAGLAIDTASLPAACTQVPAGSQTLECNVPAGLAIGANAIFNVSVTAQNTLNGQSVTNQALATGGGDPLCAAGTAIADLPSRCKPQATTSVNAPMLTLSKSASSFSVGVVSNYILTVTNTGTAPTNDVITVTDLMPSSLSLGAMPAGCSAAGQQVTCTSAANLAVGSSISFTIPVTPQASASPSVSNSASVQGGGDPTCPTTGNCTATTTTAVDAPSLQLNKTDNGPWVVGQANAQYTLTVQNAHASVATVGAITIRDSMPVGITSAAGTYGNWSCTVSGQDVTCTSSVSIAASASDVISLPVTVAAAAISSGTSASITNYASVAGGGDPYNGGVPPLPGASCTDTSHCASKLTTVSTAAAITVAKTLTRVGGAAVPVGYQVQPGDELTYTIAVNNSGGTPGGATLTETVPTGTSYVGVAEGWSVSPGACAAAGSTCTQSVLVGPASSASVDFTVRVEVPLVQGQISNAVTSNVPDSCGAACNVTTPAAPADMAVVSQPPVSVSLGTTVTVTSSCTNQGPAAALNANCVVSGVPADASGVSTVCSIGGVTISLPVASLASAAVIDCMTTFTPASTGLVNITTTGSSTSYDPDGSNNTGATPVTISLTPTALALTKVGPVSAVSGESVTYTLTVTNSGQTAAAAGAVVYDQLPAGMAATSASGASCSPLASAGALLRCTLDSAVAANGGSAVIMLQAIAPDTQGSLTNYASVDPAGGNTPPVPGASCTGAHCASTTTTISLQPGLIVLKTNSADTVTQASLVTYTVTISNPGTTAVSGLSWSDKAASGLSELKITGQAGDAKGSDPGLCVDLACTGITVAAGGSVSYTVSAKVTGAIGSTAANSAVLVGGHCTVDTPCISTDTDSIVPAQVTPVPVDSRSALVILALLLLMFGFIRHPARKEFGDKA